MLPFAVHYKPVLVIPANRVRSVRAHCSTPDIALFTSRSVDLRVLLCTRHFNFVTVAASALEMALDDVLGREVYNNREGPSVALD